MSGEEPLHFTFSFGNTEERHYFVELDVKNKKTPFRVVLRTAYEEYTKNEGKKERMKCYSRRDALVKDITATAESVYYDYGSRLFVR